MSSNLPVTVQSVAPGSSEQRWQAYIVAAVNGGLIVDGDAEPTPDSLIGSARPRIPAAAIRRAVLDPGLKPDPIGMRFAHIDVSGVLDLSFIRSECSLQFEDCTFDKGLDIENAEFPRLDLSGSTTARLTIDGSTFQSGVDLSDLTCSGVLSAVTTQITGLDLDGATLGEAAESGSTVLDLSGSRVVGVLTVSNSTITGEVKFIETVAPNQVRLIGTTVNGGLTLDGAQFGSTLYGEALKVVGETQAIGASFDDDVHLSKASFSAPGENALSLHRSRIGGRLSLHEASIQGTFDASQLHAAKVYAHGTTFEKPGSEGAISADEAEFGTLELLPARLEGTMSLVRASISSLETNMVMPAALRLEGMRLKDVHGPMRDNSKVATAWLDLAEGAGFSPQPWHELADFYDRIGQPAHSKRLRVQAAARVTRQAPVASRTARTAYACLVGYGYRPLRPFLWLLAVSAVALGCVFLATGEGFIPSAPTVATASSPPAWCGQRITAASSPKCLNPSYPGFDPWTAALTLVTPAGAVSNPAWIPGFRWLVFILTAIKLAGWLLTALLLAGVTGLLRKQ